LSRNLPERLRYESEICHVVRAVDHFSAEWRMKDIDPAPVERCRELGCAKGFGISDPTLQSP